MDDLVRLTIVDIETSGFDSTPVLLLKEVGGHRCLAIWVSHKDAMYLTQVVQGIAQRRPQSQDLMIDVVMLRDAEERFGVITAFDDGIYESELHLGDHVLDARPSDLAALSARTGMALWCTKELMDTVGIEIDLDPHDEIEDFKDFLDHITPEDFD